MNNKEAELKAKNEAEAKAEAELKAKNEAEAKAEAEKEEKMLGFKTIYSTLSNDQVFPSYIRREGKQVSARKVRTAILIRGGANVANKHHQTKKFAETQISNQEFKTLESHPVFKRMIERGFFSLKKPTSSKKDKCAPLDEKDIKKKNAKATVVTNTEKPE